MHNLVTLTALKFQEYVSHVLLNGLEMTFAPRSNPHSYCFQVKLEQSLEQ